MENKRNHDHDLYEKRMSAQHGTMFQKEGKNKREVKDCIFRESGTRVVIAGITKKQYTCSTTVSRFCNDWAMKSCSHRRTMKLLT